jgi:hypothetical protein
MLTRVVLAVACCLTLVAPTALAAERGQSQDESVEASAAMYSQIVDRGSRRVQVFDQLCGEPRARKDCVPVPIDMRQAIKRAFDRPVSWVDHLHPRSGRFWVLAPIVWGDGLAKVRVAFRETKRYGCTGRETWQFAWDGANWTTKSGSGSEACPAIPQ